MHLIKKRWKFCLASCAQKTPYYDQCHSSLILSCCLFHSISTNWAKGKPRDCPCRSLPQRPVWRHWDSSSAHQGTGSLPTKASAEPVCWTSCAVPCRGVSKDLGETDKSMEVWSIFCQRNSEVSQGTSAQDRVGGETRGWIRICCSLQKS